MGIGAGNEIGIGTQNLLENLELLDLTLSKGLQPDTPTQMQKRLCEVIKV